MHVCNGMMFCLNGGDFLNDGPRAEPFDPTGDEPEWVGELIDAALAGRLTFPGPVIVIFGANGYFGTSDPGKWALSSYEQWIAWNWQGEPCHGECRMKMLRAIYDCCVAREPCPTKVEKPEVPVTVRRQSTPRPKGISISVGGKKYGAE